MSMMSSICRRLISGKKIASFPILRPRKFCTAAAAAPTPCLMLPPHFIGGRDMVYNFYSPTKDKVVSFNNRGGEEETQLMQDDKTKVVGSSHGWLALYNSSNRGMILSNPVSGRRIDLPPLAGKPFSDEVWPEKLVLSCPPDDEECRAVLIFDFLSKVAFCCPGRSRHWAPLPFCHDERPHLNGVASCFIMYLDLVYSAARKRFVALVYTVLMSKRDLSLLNVEHWDISEPSCPRMDRVERVGTHHNWINWSEEPRLASAYMVSVEESGQLFLVAQRCMLDSLLSADNDKLEDEEFHYDVYRIKDGGGLELCSSLDDLAIFVGVNHSIASPSPKVKHNCIYYADPNFRPHDGQYIEIFDYKTRTGAPLYFPTRHQKNQSPITWITPTFD